MLLRAAASVQVPLPARSEGTPLAALEGAGVRDARAGTEGMPEWPETLAQKRPRPLGFRV